MSEKTIIDAKEVEKFDTDADKWWDPKGPFAPLHELNPTRLTYIRDQICAHFGKDTNAPASLENITLLDIGCGGGLVSEPLARLSATVTGIDPGSANIEAAKAHSEPQGLNITYRNTNAEALVEANEQFDVVLCLEVVEHVPDVQAFVEMIGKLVKPGGILLLSTINRTLKSFALAIVGAEYILRWLEPGTHQWERFVKPEELKEAITKSGLTPTDERGMMYNPLGSGWRLTSDTDVNYFLSAKKPN